MNLKHVSMFSKLKGIVNKDKDNRPNDNKDAGIISKIRELEAIKKKYETEINTEIAKLSGALTAENQKKLEAFNKKIDQALKILKSQVTGSITLTPLDPLGQEYIELTGGRDIQLGEVSGHDDNPQHKVALSPFWLAKTQVTQKQYEDIMGINPANFKGKKDSAARPVENVTWYNAIEYCRRLSLKADDIPQSVKDELAALEINLNDKGNPVADQDKANALKYVELALKTNGLYRLPTETEWEYAARSGVNNKYPWEKDEVDDDIHKYAWTDVGSKAKNQTHPVGILEPNKFGLYDMIGNVWEWCIDLYQDSFYSSLAENAEDPVNLDSGSRRVLRGGSWYINYGENLQSAYRNLNAADYRDNNNGFRLARTVRP